MTFKKPTLKDLTDVKKSPIINLAILLSNKFTVSTHSQIVNLQIQLGSARYEAGQKHYTSAIKSATLLLNHKAYTNSIMNLLVNSNTLEQNLMPSGYTSDPINSTKVDLPETNNASTKHKVILRTESLKTSSNQYHLQMLND